jgi:hypothetical protein
VQQNYCDVSQKILPCISGVRRSTSNVELIKFDLMVCVKKFINSYCVKSNLSSLIFLFHELENCSILAKEKKKYHPIVIWPSWSHTIIPVYYIHFAFDLKVRRLQRRIIYFISLVLSVSWFPIFSYLFILLFYPLFISILIFPSYRHSTSLVSRPPIYVQTALLYAII